MWPSHVRSLVRFVAPRFCYESRFLLSNGSASVAATRGKLFLSSQTASSSSQIKEMSSSVAMPVFDSAGKLYSETSEPDSLLRRLEVEVRCHDTAVLNSYEKFIRIVCEELGLNLVSVLTPPTAHERRSVLKSVHVHKIHRVQYEMRTHFRVFQIKHLTGSTADTFLEYVQRNLPEGMSMKVTKARIERLPEHIRPPAKVVPTKEPDYEADPNEHFPPADDSNEKK